MINQLIYHNGNKILVGAAEKAGSSTIILTMGYPVLGKFKSRRDREALLKKGLWKEIYHKGVTNWIEYPIRIAVVRDPVERLISCYRDRVLIKNIDKIRDIYKSVSSFVDNLDIARQESEDLFKHSRPLVDILGPASNYTKIIDMENISTEFVPIIKQVSGNNNVPDIIFNKNTKAEKVISTNKDIQKIKKYYKEDYEEYGSYFVY